MTFFFLAFQFLGGGAQAPWAPPGHAPVTTSDNFQIKDKPRHKLVTIN